MTWRGGRTDARRRQLDLIRRSLHSRPHPSRFRVVDAVRALQPVQPLQPAPRPRPAVLAP